MAAPLGSRLGLAAWLGAVGLGILVGLSFSQDVSPAEAPPRDENASESPPEIDPLGPNAACYVCHITFVREELSRTHLREKVACIDCHGLSAAHANDEDIGATPPDVTFKRHEIDASCRECHEGHDVPAREVIARWLEREQPGPSPVCTDCHGSHKIERLEGDETENASIDETVRHRS
jgi:hypothetical protein